MWRRPVGHAGSGPGNNGSFRIRYSDYEPAHIPGVILRVVDGRRLPQEFIDEMMEARKSAPEPVNFVQQMRERKFNGASQGPSSADRP